MDSRPLNETRQKKTMILVLQNSKAISGQCQRKKRLGRGQKTGQNSEKKQKKETKRGSILNISSFDMVTGEPSAKEVYRGMN